MKMTLFVLPLLLASNVLASTGETNLECTNKDNKINITINEGAKTIQVKGATTSILFTIDETKSYDVDDGKVTSYDVIDGKDAIGFTLSGEIAVLSAKNGDKKAAMRLRNNELAKTVISTDEMPCK